MKLREDYKCNVAKNFTELAIQNNLIKANIDPEVTAQNVCKFFNTIAENLGESSDSNEV